MYFNLPLDIASGLKKVSSVAVTDDLTKFFLVFFRRLVGLAKTMQFFLLTNLEYHLLSTLLFDKSQNKQTFMNV